MIFFELLIIKRRNLFCVSLEIIIERQIIQTNIKDNPLVFYRINKKRLKRLLSLLGKLYKWGLMQKCKAFSLNPLTQQTLLTSFGILLEYPFNSITGKMRTIILIQYHCSIYL